MNTSNRALAYFQALIWPLVISVAIWQLLLRLDRLLEAMSSDRTKEKVNKDEQSDAEHYDWHQSALLRLRPDLGQKPAARLLHQPWADSAGLALLVGWSLSFATN